MALLCSAPHCRTRGRHLPDCDTPDCTGCEPRVAADGIRLCEIDVRRLSEDARTAARLHDDLTQTLVRTGRGGEPTSGSSAGAPVPDDDVMEARDAIRVTLVSLCRLVACERGIHPPEDTASAMGAYLVRHATWLAAHPAAGEHAGDLRDIAGDGRTWRLAYPVGSDQQYLGPCGALIVEDYERSEPLPGVLAESATTRQCDGDVYAKPGAEQGVCRLCPATYDVAERQEWLYNDVLPAYSFRASEIAYAYGIPPHWIRFQAFSRPEERRADGTLLKPARHARLLPHDRDPSGRPRYLIRDVLALWQAERDRREAKREKRSAA